MYLLSLYEKDMIVEASLGGRVTAEEVTVFGEELADLLEDLEGQAFSLLIDFSKAKRFDGLAISALNTIKDRCFEIGAVEIVSVPVDEHDAVTHQSARLQFVLEGRERFVSSPAEARFQRTAASPVIMLAAA